MDSKLPKISIIIPCYNNQNTIIETIQSVINQDYKNIEIVVVNDGSIDDSQKVINEFISDKDNAILINKINEGPSIARNTGVDNASGEFIVFLDGDDIIAKTFLSSCYKIFENDKNINIVYTDAEFFGAKSGKWILPDFELRSFLIQNCIPITAMLKRSVFNEVGQFDTNLKYTEDWELWIRIIKKYAGVFKINETLFFYRKHENKSSLTDNVDVEKEEKILLYIYQKHYDLYKSNGYGIKLLFEEHKYKKKYYNIWYKKLFYSIKGKKY